MKAKNRLHELEVPRVDLVDRGAVRDPENPTEPNRFLLFKAEGGDPQEENPVRSDRTKRLADALAKAAENEAALDEFIAKSEMTPETATAIKGAFRLLSLAKAEVSAETLESLAGALGVEKDMAGGDGAFGTQDPDGKPQPPHPFKPKEDADGMCADCGQGGNAAVHNTSEEKSEGEGEAEGEGEGQEPEEKDEAGTEDAEEQEKSEAGAELTLEEVLKAAEGLPEAVQLAIKKSMESAQADREAREKAEQAIEVEKAERRKAEITQLVKDEMGHAPGISQADLVELLHTTREGGDTARYDQLVASFKAASAAVTASPLFKEEGSGANGNAGATAADQLARIAEGIQKAEGVTRAKASSLASDRNPELYARYQEEQRAAAAAAR